MPVTLEIAKSIIAELPQREKDKLAIEMQEEASFSNDIKALKSQIVALVLFDAINGSMTVHECADFLKCNHQTVRSMIDKKKIKVNFCKARVSIPKLQFLDEILENFLKDKEEREKEILLQYNL